MQCLYMFRKSVYTDFLQESLDFYYFAVDVYVPEAGWNLTLHLGLYPRVRFFFSSPSPLEARACNCAIAGGINVPFKVSTFK